MKDKKEKYKIRSHTFKGSDSFGFTYEITFNRSLDHTIKMNAMCKGMDEYEKKENRSPGLFKRLRFLFTGKYNIK